MKYFALIAFSSSFVKRMPTFAASNSKRGILYHASIFSLFVGAALIYVWRKRTVIPSLFSTRKKITAAYASLLASQNVWMLTSSHSFIYPNNHWGIWISLNFSNSFVHFKKRCFYVYGWLSKKFGIWKSFLFKTKNFFIHFFLIN